MEGIIEININGKAEHLKITMWQVRRASELIQQKPEDSIWVSACFIMAGLENYYRKIEDGKCHYTMQEIEDWIDEYSANKENFEAIKSINAEIMNHHLYKAGLETKKKMDLENQ